MRSNPGNVQSNRVAIKLKCNKNEEIRERKKTSWKNQWSSTKKKAAVTFASLVARPPLRFATKAKDEKRREKKMAKQKKKWPVDEERTEKDKAVRGWQLLQDCNSQPGTVRGPCNQQLFQRSWNRAGSLDRRRETPWEMKRMKMDPIRSEAERK